MRKASRPDDTSESYRPKFRVFTEKAHGEGDCGCHQAEKDEALAPQRAPTGFIAQCIERGQGLG